MDEKDVLTREIYKRIAFAFIIFVFLSYLFSLAWAWRGFIIWWALGIWMFWALFPPQNKKEKIRAIIAGIGGLLWINWWIIGEITRLLGALAFLAGWFVQLIFVPKKEKGKIS